MQLLQYIGNCCTFVTFLGCRNYCKAKTANSYTDRETENKAYPEPYFYVNFSKIVGNVLAAWKKSGGRHPTSLRYTVGFTADLGHRTRGLSNHQLPYTGKQRPYKQRPYISGKVRPERERPRLLQYAWMFPPPSRFRFWNLAGAAEAGIHWLSHFRWSSRGEAATRRLSSAVAVVYRQLFVTAEL